jgi:hypothetical protein
MARKSIKSNYYLFDASAREVVIPGGIQREQLILITNVTDNKVIYNFSDPELTASVYSIETDIRNVTTTRVTLAYDTTSMSDTDKLQIVYDEFEETIKPAETYMDSVNKQRVSNPQSLIDTDFEYSTQSTKWESLAMINNNPFAYKSNTTLDVTQVEAFTNTKTIRVTIDTNNSALPSAGDPVFVQDTTFPGANGVFIVDSAGSGSNNANQFSYTAGVIWTQGNSSIQISARTNIYTGIHYSNSRIGGSITLSAPGDDSVNVLCTNAHGLEVGNEVAIVGSNGNNVNGSWIVASVISPVQFKYYPSSAPTGGVGSGTAKLYPRPQGNSVHRAFDGGVKFSTNTLSKNQQAIRQTKRYFRYQSGKGVAFSTGSILAPAIENLDSITASGTNITVVASVAHNISRGSEIDVRGCDDNNYNGTYTVTAVIDPFTFKYTSTLAPTVSSAGGSYTITPINTYGVNLELGMMDQQNGIFFRYAHGEIEVVRRSSTFQCSGRVTVTNGSSVISSYTGVNGAGTSLAKQLNIGDNIVLRGSSYRVDGIISDTQIIIFPDYRGPSDINVPITKTQEIIWKQDQWNIDRCDGSGKSGYTIDVTKMQMFYMDYSWYGAGFIRWGFRGTNGDVIYAHKIPNNNFNNEAYMRSGNLPARYEVNTICPFAVVTKSVSNSDSVLYVNKGLDRFPSSGTLRIRQVDSATSATQEYVNYTSKSTFAQDVLATEAAGNTLSVASTGGLQGNGVQPIQFDRPFANIVANKTYFVATVPNSTSFTITETASSSTPISITASVGSALSPLAVAESGTFTGLTREAAGAVTTGNTTSGSNIVQVASSTGIQVGQVVKSDDIPDDTFVSEIAGVNITLSTAATATATGTSIIFAPMGAGSAETFTYDTTRPIGVELLRATSVPQISHWGSSVIMEGEYDEDRAYIYSIGTKTGRSVSSGQTKGILALRVCPAVDNGITGAFGSRELINRMQLVMRDCQIVANGVFFVELLLNPTVDVSSTWQSVGGTSLAQYAVLGTNAELVGGEVVYAFYAGAGGFGAGASTVPLDQVKEISNCILGGGKSTFDNNFPSGVFPDGPEVLAVRVTNIAGGFGSSARSADFKFSWTEAQA